MGWFFSASWGRPHCCAVLNVGNGDFILLPQLQESLKRGKLKSCWAPSRELPTYGTTWPFPYVPIPFLSIFGSQSLFVQVTAGIQHIIHYLFSTFSRADHTFTWINRLLGTGSIITYLELFLYTLEHLRLESHLCPVWDHDYCVSLASVVSFSQDSCHLSFSFTRYFC